jgi:hypothetical protein
MNRNLLIAIFLIGSVAALLAGAYWYMAARPSVRSAGLYAEPSLQTAPSTAPSAQVESTPDPGAASGQPEATNPPLSSGGSLSEIESDLNNTIIEEEVFSDL